MWEVHLHDRRELDRFVARSGSMASTARSASGLTSWKTAAPRSRKNVSISSSWALVGGEKSPRPNVCVIGEPTPLNIAYVPPTSRHSAPTAGATRARDSTNAAFALASARSRRCESARSVTKCRPIQVTSALGSQRQHERRAAPDHDRVLVMDRQHAVVRAKRPAVRLPRRRAPARSSTSARARSRVPPSAPSRRRVGQVRHARLLVNATADAVTGELAHDAAPSRLAACSTARPTLGATAPRAPRRCPG